MTCWRSCFWSRRSGCGARKHSGERFKTSRRCGTYFFRSGRTRRIGTRGSLLAKWQAEFIRKQLFAATGMEAEIVVIKTAGDKMQHAPLMQIGGKGIFIKELEEALLGETIDLAVHSEIDGFSKQR